jgi:F0F1-type ATP synthase gamma subunit
MEISNDHIELLEHALGDKNHYRNFFGTTKNSSDIKLLYELVDMELMEVTPAPNWMVDDYLFYVTDKGKNFAFNNNIINKGEKTMNTKNDEQVKVRTVCKPDKQESLITIIENQVKIDSNNSKYCDHECPRRYIGVSEIYCTLFRKGTDKQTVLFSKDSDSIRHDTCMAIFENERRIDISQPPIKDEIISDELSNETIIKEDENERTDENN